MKSFEDLEAWKSARSYRIEISIVVKDFPKHEQFRLTDQLIRSGRSITANIAEGHGRFYYKENVMFCRRARGSLTESLDHLICANDEKYVDDITMKKLRTIYHQCLKLLNGYIAYLKKRENESQELKTPSKLNQLNQPIT